MRKLGYLVLGLALLVGALSLAGYRHLPNGFGASKSVTATNRSTSPQISQSAKSGGQSGNQSFSAVQIFDMGLNLANVVVGVLGIWMTMRGFRAERRAEVTLALRRDR